MIRLEDIIKQGGATLTRGTLTSVPYTYGYQVSIYDGFKIDLELLKDNEVFKELLYTLASKTQPGQNIGLWVDNGYLYGDISVHVDTFKEAIKLGVRYNQRAIYDWANNTSIMLESEDK